jgi:hypothetical protein
MPSHFTLFNSSSTSIFFNNSTSSSCLYLCSLFCASFSFVILYSFSIAIFAFMFMWSSELWKSSQLPTINEKPLLTITPFIFVLELLAYRIHFFTYPLSFNQRMIFKINTTHHYHFVCPLFSHVEARRIIIMNEHLKFNLSINPHP